MKKRFIFDENYIKRYAKKDKMRWLVIGGCALILILVVIIVIIATKSRVRQEPEPVKPEFELKEELVVESGSTLPEVADYFTKLENIKVEDIKITYPEEFNISYDLSRCNDADLEKINGEEEVDMSEFTCAIPILKSPTVYGITLTILDKDYTVNLKVQDTTPPVILTNNVEIFEGEIYELEDFISACYDESDVCEVDYVTDEKDEEGNVIDYAHLTEPGEYTIKLKAVDGFENETDVVETELTIVEVEDELFDVIFDSNGGSDVESIKVLKGTAATEPEMPYREGYYFLGWYLENSRYDFELPVEESLTLRAQWQKMDDSGTTTPQIPGGPTPQGPINVTSVYLNYKLINVYIGESKTVTATVKPSNATNKTVTWSSSNNNIATVNNGVITGVGEGTATITATASGKSATVTVVVRKKNGSSTTTPSGCQYGDTNYNTGFTLSVNLTQGGCAVDPNRTYNESISDNDYSSAFQELVSMGFNMSDARYFTYKADKVPVKNNAGTGLVGYQITVKWSVADVYQTLSCEYIIKSDGSRQFISNTIKKNNVTFR